MPDWLLRNCEAVFQKRGQAACGADIQISGRVVVAVGKNLPHGEGAREVDCRGKVALPGLINGHHHFFQSLTRCLPKAQNLELFDWLSYHYGIWRYLDEEGMRAASRLTIAELLLTGCTTTLDHHYLFPRGSQTDFIGTEIEAARELGIRFCGARGSMTKGKSKGGPPPDELTEDDDLVLRACEEAIHKWHDPERFSMCQIALAPCTPFNVTERLLKETATLARKHGVRLHTHLAETRDETEWCESRFGKRPLAFVEELGWEGADTSFAHGVQLDDAELNRLAQSKSSVVHCPSSNMRLGSGAANVPGMLARGVPVGMGVDGSASNDTSDMLGELRTAMLLARANHGASALSAEQVISMATEGSAKVLGREELGSLDVGMAADIALFDLDELSYAGAADPVAALVFCGANYRAWAVMVNGEWVVKDRRLVRGDERRIKEDAVIQAKRLWGRAGI